MVRLLIIVLALGAIGAVAYGSEDFDPTDIAETVAAGVDSTVQARPTPTAVPTAVRPTAVPTAAPRDAAFFMRRKCRLSKKYHSTKVRG